MKIRDIFDTKIEDRIEQVVKVVDRRPAILLDELRNLVITPQWEQYLHRMLLEYTENFENEAEQDIGIWISGFFGSGKSLLMKTLGVLLEGGKLAGQPVHETLLDRLPADSAERSDIERFLALCQRRMTCTAIGGNLHTQLAGSDDPLTLIAFRLFAKTEGYSNIWPFAWAVEYQIDERGLLPEFRRIASELCKRDWDEVAEDASFYSVQLYEAAARVLPDHFRDFSAVELATDNAQRNGITPEMLIKRLRRWCENKDTAMKRHKLLLQLDELGQWIQGGWDITRRIMDVQALVESASTFGAGRIWMVVTAHGDIQALEQNVQQEYYAKINQRFVAKCKLSNEDINMVVQERLLRKNMQAASELRKYFQQHSDELYDLGTLKGTRRSYPHPDAESFARFYPYMPWTVAAIPDITKGIAQAAGRGEELTGSSRTMIGVVQGGILDAKKNLLEEQTDQLLCLADLYSQFESDVLIETKTDLRRILETVHKANTGTVRVAQALYLLGQAGYITCTLDNILRALVTSVHQNIAALRPTTKEHLELLINAGYAKQVGDSYVFLTPQQRTFQGKVQAKQGDLLNRTSDLILKLREFEGDDALRFDEVPISGMSGRRKVLRLILDGSVAKRSQNLPEQVTIQVYSPLQRIIAPEIGNDEEMKQRSLQNQNGFFLRMENVPDLRRVLVQAAATEEVADQVINTGQSNDPEYKVAQQAKADVAEYKRLVRHYLAQAVRNGILFFRGTAYYPTDGDNASAVIRNTLSQLLPQIYSRFSDVPHRINDEARAVKDALDNVTNNNDLVELKVYKSDGTLNEGNSLLSTLRSRIPLAEDDQGMISAEQLRQDLEKPPFGWDGNCVKVGLALLLHASACRLIESGNMHTNPRSAEVLQLLTRETRFKTVRVQGIRTEIGMEERQKIRGYMDTIFGVKPQVVPAIINDKLKEELQKLQKQANEIESWAHTAVCPLPLPFEAGTSLIAELLNSNAINVRLPHFMREAETVLQYVKLLHELSKFKKEHGSEYVAVREFYSSMLNVENQPEEVRNFVQSWSLVIKERTVTDPVRWNELIQVYHAAQQGLTNQIDMLQQEAKKALVEIEEPLHQRVVEAGIPEADIDTALTELYEVLRPARERIERTSPSITEARTMKTTIFNSRLNLSKKIQEIRARYQAEEPVQPQETYMTWSKILGQRRITSPDDLKQIMDTLQRLVITELEQHHIVIID